MIRKSTLWLAAAALLLAGTAGCPKNGGEPNGKTVEKPLIGRLAKDARQPNIIFILIDTLRADRVGACGSKRGLTPNLDAIAAEGLVFDDAVAAAPWTLPSVGSLFTSYYPSVHKAVSYSEIAKNQKVVEAAMAQHRPPPQVSVLQDELQTLAETMQLMRFETAAFSANGFIQAEYGFGQGFETFVNAWQPEQNSIPAPNVIAPALKWLDGRKNTAKPFFMYLHFMDVHGPYNADAKYMDPQMAKFDQAPPTTRISVDEFNRINAYMRKPPEPLTQNQAEYFAKYQRYREYWEARYDAGVAEMDDYLGQLKAALQERGVWDDAYVIIIADHGEALNDHAGLWEHGYSQFQTDLSVPIVLRWPEVVPTGHVSTRVSLMDVMPTLIDQFGDADISALQGHSLVPLFPGNPGDAERPHFSEALKFWGGEGLDGKAIFDGQWKYVEAPISDDRLGAYLFDLSKDPGETTNLARNEPTIASRLKSTLDEQVALNATVKPDITVTVTDVSEQSRNQLADVGYLGDDHAEEKLVELRAKLGLPNATAEQLKDAVTRDNRIEVGKLLGVSPPNIQNIRKKIDGLFEDMKNKAKDGADGAKADVPDDKKP
ncbi:MAG: sulfatase-like hydrolase/transferase [Phycisphaerales bacterium]|nr:sulfatase-like hydrolase/transferase [Phycisphaerales bacterium]